MQTHEFILIWLLFQLIPGIMFWSFWWFDMERTWKKYGYYNIKGTDVLMSFLFPAIVLAAALVFLMNSVFSWIINTNTCKKMGRWFTKTLFLVEKKEKNDGKESS